MTAFRLADSNAKGDVRRSIKLADVVCP